MLKSQDLLDVINIGRTALKCDQIDVLRKEVLKLISETLHVERSNFFLAQQCPYPRLDHEHVISQGVEQKYISLFREYYYKMDPFVRIINDSKSVATTGNDVSFQELENSEYYNDFLKPQSIHYQMSVYLKSGRQLLGTLAMFRSKHEKDFSPREKAKCELLVSPLVGALEKTIYFDEVTKSKKIIDSICQDMPYKGIIVLDESLDPLFVNEEARCALSVLAEMKEPKEEASFSLPKELQLRLAELVEDVKQRGDTAGKRIVTLQNKRTGQIVSSSFRVINRSQGSRLYLICVGQDKRSERLNVQGLTRREQEITSLVCEGHKNSEIAEKLFISEATVENHLHSIYGKLDVKNRTSLVHHTMHSNTK